jgi:hypothetical protein
VRFHDKDGISGRNTNNVENANYYVSASIQCSQHSSLGGMSQGTQKSGIYNLEKQSVLKAKALCKPTVRKLEPLIGPKHSAKKGEIGFLGFVARYKIIYFCKTEIEKLFVFLARRRRVKHTTVSSEKFNSTNDKTF